MQLERRVGKKTGRAQGKGSGGVAYITQQWGQGQQRPLLLKKEEAGRPNHELLDSSACDTVQNVWKGGRHAHATEPKPQVNFLLVCAVMWHVKQHNLAPVSCRTALSQEC